MSLIHLSEYLDVLAYYLLENLSAKFLAICFQNILITLAMESDRQQLPKTGLKSGAMDLNRHRPPLKSRSTSIGA